MLEIKNVSKRFGDKEVINGLSLKVPENTIFGFIGSNGAGKTTTMKMVLGLLKPDDGEIYVAGEKVVFGQTLTNKHIGYLPDVPEYYSFMTAKEYLDFCGDITDMSREECKKRRDELLELVGLSNEKHRIKGYSRGMKQRLGIAQALLNKPKLLICDEPTSALDPVGRKEILDILLAVKSQTTVIFSTHILSDVERICTDIAFLNDGNIKLQGKLSDIKEKYRKEEYEIEVEGSVETILSTFAECSVSKDVNLSNKCLLFRGDEEKLFQLLKFIVDKRIVINKINRLEPSLENLFLEVLGK